MMKGLSHKQLQLAQEPFYFVESGEDGIVSMKILHVVMTWIRTS